MRKIFTLLFLSVLITGQAFAQVNRCSTVEHEAVLRAKYPDYDAKRAAIEAYTQQYTKKNNILAKAEGAEIITIPVVFHVVYKTAGQNIPDARILEQLDILNQDFRRLNADTTDTPDAFSPVGADCSIEFCLAQVDPEGNPTTGILRVETAAGSFSGDEVKFDADGGSDAWPADSYLNFWVCNLGAFLLGYAQFPGGPDATDGVVINFENVGLNDAGYPYHLGRTATHEIGHWLNLRHIWGDDSNCAGTDFVDDTPNQKVETYGCPGFPKTDACSAVAPGIMFQNYMDYSDDACMNIFTEGQKQRMMALFEPGGERYGLISSDGCGLQPYDAQAVSSLPGGTICDLSVTPKVVIKNHGAAELISVDINYSVDGGATSTYEWTGSLLSAETEEVTLPAVAVTEGDHTLEVTLDNPNGFIDADFSDNTTSTDFTVNLGTLPLPVVEGFEDTGFPYTGYSLSNPDGGETWERTTTAAALGSASIFMNHFNYDSPGEIDEFVLPAYDLTGLADIVFTFDVAYALYTADGSMSDTLEVLVSDDCGDTWTTVYKKANPDLQTAPIHTISFKPEDDEWRNESIDLDAYIGTEQFFVKFRTITDYENNLYIDNININNGQIQSVNNNQPDFAMNLYPNPANDNVQIRYNVPVNGNGSLSITDVLGKVVYSTEIGVSYGVNVVNVNTAAFASGYYQVTLNCEGLVASESLVKE